MKLWPTAGSISIKKTRNSFVIFGQSQANSFPCFQCLCKANPTDGSNYVFTVYPFAQRFMKKTFVLCSVHCTDEQNVQGGCFVCVNLCEHVHFQCVDVCMTWLIISLAIGCWGVLLALLMTPEGIDPATVAQVRNRCVPVLEKQQSVHQLTLMKLHIRRAITNKALGCL